jgi:phospholipase C
VSEHRSDDQPARPGDQPARPQGEPTRRAFMGGAAAVGLGAAVAGRPGQASAARARLIDKALGAATSSASLSDVQHIVILMQENRSFDHYFGTLSGVRGFSDPAVPQQTVGGKQYPVFDQFGFQPGTGVAASGYMQPFHLQNNPPTENGETTNDIAHDWGTQHNSWHNGAMNAFITAHLASDGATNGPVVETFTDRIAEYSQLSWETMPQRLLSAGVSWKVYNDPTGLLGLSPLPYFEAVTGDHAAAPARAVATVRRAAVAAAGSCQIA